MSNTVQSIVENTNIVSNFRVSNFLLCRELDRDLLSTCDSVYSHASEAARYASSGRGKQDF